MSVPSAFPKTRKELIAWIKRPESQKMINKIGTLGIKSGTAQINIQKLIGAIEKSSANNIYGIMTMYEQIYTSTMNVTAQKVKAAEKVATSTETKARVDKTGRRRAAPKTKAAASPAMPTSVQEALDKGFTRDQIKAHLRANPDILATVSDADLRRLTKDDIGMPRPALAHRRQLVSVRARAGGGKKGKKGKKKASPPPSAAAAEAAAVKAGAAERAAYQDAWTNASARARRYRDDPAAACEEWIIMQGWGIGPPSTHGTFTMTPYNPRDCEEYFKAHEGELPPHTTSTWRCGQLVAITFGALTLWGLSSAIGTDSLKALLGIPDDWIAGMKVAAAAASPGAARAVEELAADAHAFKLVQKIYSLLYQWSVNIASGNLIFPVIFGVIGAIYMWNMTKVAARAEERLAQQMPEWFSGVKGRGVGHFQDDGDGGKRWVPLNPDTNEPLTKDEEEKFREDRKLYGSPFSFPPNFDWGAMLKRIADFWQSPQYQSKGVQSTPRAILWIVAVGAYLSVCCIVCGTAISEGDKRNAAVNQFKEFFVKVAGVERELEQSRRDGQHHATDDHRATDDHACTPSSSNVEITGNSDCTLSGLSASPEKLAQAVYAYFINPSASEGAIQEALNVLRPGGCATGPTAAAGGGASASSFSLDTWAAAVAPLVIAVDPSETLRLRGTTDFIPQEFVSGYTRRVLQIGLHPTVLFVNKRGRRRRGRLALLKFVQRGVNEIWRQQMLLNTFTTEWCTKWHDLVARAAKAPGRRRRRQAEARLVGAINAALVAADAAPCLSSASAAAREKLQTLRGALESPAPPRPTNLAKIAGFGHIKQEGPDQASIDFYNHYCGEPTTAVSGGGAGGLIAGIEAICDNIRLNGLLPLGQLRQLKYMHFLRSPGEDTGVRRTYIRLAVLVKGAAIYAAEKGWTWGATARYIAAPIATLIMMEPPGPESVIIDQRRAGQLSGEIRRDSHAPIPTLLHGIMGPFVWVLLGVVKAGVGAKRLSKGALAKAMLFIQSIETEYPTLKKIRVAIFTAAEHAFKPVVMPVRHLVRAASAAAVHALAPGTPGRAAIAANLLYSQVPPGPHGPTLTEEQKAAMIAHEGDDSDFEDDDGGGDDGGHDRYGGGKTKRHRKRHKKTKRHRKRRRKRHKKTKRHRKRHRRTKRKK